MREERIERERARVWQWDRGKGSIKFAAENCISFGNYKAGRTHTYTQFHRQPKTQNEKDNNEGEMEMKTKTKTLNENKMEMENDDENAFRH